MEKSTEDKQNSKRPLARTAFTLGLIGSLVAGGPAEAKTTDKAMPTTTTEYKGGAGGPPTYVDDGSGESTTTTTELTPTTTTLPEGTVVVDGNDGSGGIHEQATQPPVAPAPGKLPITE